MNFLTRHSSFIFYTLWALVVAVLDVWAGTQVNLWVLYCLPIGLATWNLGRKPGCALAVLSGVLMVGGALVYGHPYSSLVYLAIACVSKIIIYTVLVCLLAALRKQEIERVYLPKKARD